MSATYKNEIEESIYHFVVGAIGEKDKARDNAEIFGPPPAKKNIQTPQEWIETFGLQPLRQVALTRNQMSLIQKEAISYGKANAKQYPCKHGATNYCGLCEHNIE